MVERGHCDGKWNNIDTLESETDMRNCHHVDNQPLASTNPKVQKKGYKDKHYD